MEGFNTNTTLLGAITIGVYAFIARFLWETFMRVWKVRKANGDPPKSEPAAALPAQDLSVVAADAAATRLTADKIKSDTSHLKLADSERAGSLKDISESNTRQETMMATQTQLMEKQVALSGEQVQLLKKNGGG